MQQAIKPLKKNDIVLFVDEGERKFCKVRNSSDTCTEIVMLSGRDGYTINFYPDKGWFVNLDGMPKKIYILEDNHATQGAVFKELIMLCEKLPRVHRGMGWSEDDEEFGMSLSFCFRLKMLKEGYSAEAMEDISILFGVLNERFHKAVIMIIQTFEIKENVYDNLITKIKEIVCVE